MHAELFSSKSSLSASCPMRGSFALVICPKPLADCVTSDAPYRFMPPPHSHKSSRSPTVEPGSCIADYGILRLLGTTAPRLDPVIELRLDEPRARGGRHPLNTPEICYP